MDSEASDEPKVEVSTTSPGIFDELRSRQERLRDSVEDIQKGLAEEKKPWYRQPTTLVSLASTLFAILSGLYSIHSARTQDISKNAADLQTIVADLIQLRTDEMQDLPSAKTDSAAYAMRSSFRNAKREALLEQAGVKLNSASYQVWPSILTILAVETDIDGDYKTSYEYLTRASKESRPHTPEKVGALFTLAQFCLTDGKALCKPGEGKSYYLAALDQQLADSDNTHYQRGQLLARVALLIHQTSPDNTEAGSYFTQADSEEAQISSSNGERQLLAQYISVARASAASTPAAQSTSFSAPDTFLGQWRIVYADGSNRSGTATFVQLPTFPFYGAYVDIFQDGKLSEKQSGQVSIADSKTLRFDWVSVRVNGQTTGYTQFVLAPAGTGILAKQYQLGDEPTGFDLKR
jgi:hypothetical protein